MLVVAFVGCLLAASMELLGIAEGLGRRFDWRWLLSSILAAVPLTYFVEFSAVQSFLSWAQANLTEWVAVTQVLSGIALVVAALVAIVALRSQQATWAATTIWSFQNDWTSDRMFQFRKKTATALLLERTTGTVQPIPEYLRVLSFFELLGFFCRRHKLPAIDAWVLFSDFASGYWLVCKPRIDKAQKADPSYHEEFAYLIRMFKEIDRSRGLAEITEVAAVNLMKSEQNL